MDLHDVAAVVTGGASGLGAATGAALAAAGARVTLLDLDRERGEAHAAEIGGQFAAVDVTDEQEVAAALDAAQAAHGIARVLVNCAGIAPGSRVVNREGLPHTLALFRKVVEINLIGTFCVTAAFAARLAKAEPVGEGRGVIVNTASVAAFDGQVGQAAYAASKGGVAAMTLPLARDLAQHGIRVMTIAPGLFLTPMLEGLPQKAQDSLGQQVPFPSRLGRPGEFAKLVLAIIASPMLNGETIRLDGALRMAPR
jgi:NAD(P)-dependent dehydrogenase (short-subunit alcohol dehydrogenase family)